MTTEVPSLTVKISIDLLEDVVLGFLYGNSLIPDKHMALGVDLGLDVNDEGLAELEVFYEEMPENWLPKDDFVVDSNPFVIMDIKEPDSEG